MVANFVAENDPFTPDSVGGNVTGLEVVVGGFLRDTQDGRQITNGQMGLVFGEKLVQVFTHEILS